MNRPAPAAAAGGRSWRWLRVLRKAFVCSALLLLLAAQVFGAIHMKGSPGLELLIAALTPGLTLLCLLQWLAGPYRLKWCVALEQVGMGAVLSVLMAVGLELITALAFGRELRSCSPPPGTRAPFATAGTVGVNPLQQQHQLGASFPEMQRETAGADGHIYTTLFQSFVDTQLVGCGIGSRGVSRHLTSYIASARRRVMELRGTDGVIGAGPEADANVYICIGFIFAYMILCIGYAEEFSKSAAMVLLRPSRVPSSRVWALGGPEDPSVFRERAEKEASSAYNYVSHPLSMVVAGCCAALGFATIENLSYVFATKSDMEMALATAWVRAFTAIPSHAANTGIAASFLASAAASAAAAAALPWRAAAAAAAEQGEAGYLENQGLQTLGEAHAVDVSSGSNNSSGTPTPPGLQEAGEISGFPCRMLLQSAVLPGLLHGSYDAALTLASAAYSSGGVEGNAVVASGWLMVALVAWWASIITFCSRWCNTKRLEDFYVYFSGAPYVGVSHHPRPAAVVPAPRPQAYLGETQQQQLLQQQLLQQQFAPIPSDVAAWQQQQQRWQQQQLYAPMYRQYAPIAPPLQQQYRERSN